VAQLREGFDYTLEVEPEELVAATQLSYADDPADVADCNFCIVAVPTPIDGHKRPDLSPLEGASRPTRGRASTGRAGRRHQRG